MKLKLTPSPMTTERLEGRNDELVIKALPWDSDLGSGPGSVAGSHSYVYTASCSLRQSLRAQVDQLRFTGLVLRC